MKRNLKFYTMYMVVAVVLVVMMPDMGVKFDTLELRLITFLKQPQTLTYTVYFIALITTILIFINLKKAKKNEK